MSKIEISFEHNLGATVYVKREGGVKKGQVIRRFYSSETLDNKFGPEVRYVVAFQNGGGTDTCIASKVFSIAEEAFA